MMVGSNLINDLAFVLLGACVGGWCARRVGLSPAIGYLVAGMLIGPASPLFPFVDEAGRVESVSQLGLVFLMFDIGRRLGWQKIKRLGLSTVAGAFLGAAFVFSAGRLFGLLLGFSAHSGLFFASLLVVSSSAIIGKVLEEIGVGRERSGQLALGVTVLEDIVAAVLLAVLGTLAKPNESALHVVGLLGGLGLFVVIVFLATLFALPRIIAWLGRVDSQEIEAVGIAGLLLGMSALALWAGYSAALGAFLIGSIAGSTRERGEVSRYTSAARDIFGSVFFVAAGMMFDPRDLMQMWPLALGVTAFAIFLRWFLIGTALVFAGQPAQDAYRAGIFLTPLGEFSFIIAQLGVQSDKMPEWFFTLAVAMSVGSSLMAPLLIRNSDKINRVSARAIPHAVKDVVSTYISWLGAMNHFLDRSLLWQLVGKRLWQVGIEMVAATALLLMAGTAHSWAVSVLGQDFILPYGFSILVGATLAFMIAIPLFAIWRNIEAISMILAEGMRGATGRHMEQLLQPVFRSVGLLIMLTWLGAVLPSNAAGGVTLALLGGATSAIFLFRNQMIRWHSLVEVELRETLSRAGEDRVYTIENLAIEPDKEWNIQLREFRVRDFSRAVGLRISDLPLRTKYGTSIAAIERQGVLIPTPRSDLLLFPGDRLLLLGDKQGIRASEKWLLSTPAYITHSEGEFDELQFAVVTVSLHSRGNGKTLAEIEPGAKHQVQIVGVERNAQKMLNPGGGFRLCAGDKLLLLALRASAEEFSKWLAGAPLHANRD